MSKAVQALTTFPDHSHLDPKLRRVVREERNRLRRKARRNRESERLAFIVSALIG